MRLKIEEATGTIHLWEIDKITIDDRFVVIVETLPSNGAVVVDLIDKEDEFVRYRVANIEDGELSFTHSTVPEGT